MKLKSIIMAALAVASIQSSQGETAKAGYNVVPLPREISTIEGKPFVLTPTTKVEYPEGNQRLERTAKLLQGYISDNLGFSPEIASYIPGKKAPKGSNPAIRLSAKSDKSDKNAEGYTLTVGTNSIEITGEDNAGTFYGVQTLRKALPVMPRDSVAQAVELDPVKISDAPRFHYRGMLLDVGRYYLPLSAVKQFIDLMAMHNMNQFHWHLTDDQGWRLELKRHPEITEKGSMRKETICGRYAGVYDGKPHGGYYTQDEVKEILAYADERHINVIPEIDLPGHTVSLLASHPEVGCTGGPYDVSTHFGPHIDILCAGKEESFKLVEEILDEVCELFPSEFINMGGDEAWKQRWEVCPDCQNKIKELGITAANGQTAEHILQGYFNKRVEKMLLDRGKNAIGWEEIFDAGVNPSTTIMAWHGFDYITNAANAGHKVIAASNKWNYLDYYQAQDITGEPFLIGHYLPLSKCYQYEPITEGLKPENRDNVIGVQGAVWGEFIDNANLMTYQALPRMAAVSESQWIQPEQKVYHAFLPRLEQLTHLYDRYQYPWCRKWE